MTSTRKGSLMARLVGHYLLLSILIVILAGLLTFVLARKALKDSVIERLGVLASLGEEQLERWIDDQRRELIFLAALPEIKRGSRALLAAGAALDGQTEDQASLRTLLRSTLELRPHLSEILILSARGGRVAVCTDQRREGEYRVRDSFFIQGLEAPYVQNVYASPAAFKPTWTVSAPLGESDQVWGVLAAHLNLKELDRVLEMRAGLGSHGEIYLVDRYNAFVSGTRFGRERFPRGVRSLGIDAAIRGTDGAGLYANYEQRPVMGVYRWIEDLELALLVEISQAEAFAPARGIASRILAAGLVVALLLAGGTWILARQVARPILEVTRAAVQVSQGNLQATAPISTNDEIGVLAHTFNDMTGRLAELYEDLRREIDERRRTQAELETKNAELERFTYTVSHDLKSPLVTIVGFLGFLEQDLAADNRQRTLADVEQIRSAATTMSRLLSELLELSRVGRLLGPPEDVDLREVAAEARSLVAGAIEARGVEVQVAADLGMVRGDRIRILEVYQNLIDNAVKFLGDEARPLVEVGRRVEGAENVYFVRDNGLGVPPEYHEKIFGLFERLEGRGEGTGVGLALVKRIVEVHGGRIWIESEGPATGATFCWTLPSPGLDDSSPGLDGPAPEEDYST